MLWALLGLGAGFTAIPLFTESDYLLNLGVQLFLAVALAQSWNVLGGFTGQITLGHAAFFGLGALVTRTLWGNGVGILLAIIPGILVCIAFSLLIGGLAFRLRGDYFAIGTLALAEMLRIIVGNLLPGISTIPSTALTNYALLPRYYLGLALAALVVGVAAALARSRIGLGMQAIREDEAAAAASGVGVLGHKLLALVISTGLAGFAGGVFAYYHASYYPQYPFSPLWSFEAILMSFIGGVGTVHGPVLGALFYTILKEYLAVRLVEIHLLIFGTLFILIVLLLPGGLVEVWTRFRRLVHRGS
ncbi:MAG: branched-chain amino acid ABC transporter permease [Candidatus Tectomicrobia bacterium]|uniref:Branched-chain amino acid ABC transporter permease n=1 Tax=Tectimicrobiota bacterium TaxID=2528274 RepID=A0A932M051_UNCTE|nr:branched-chain amino acid ABC transporter permease [Candidatus Tectomicrobia bacterium]